MRAVLGISCGLITPMAQALISSNFEGETRAKLTGYSASASYFMGIIASFTVANLAAVNWRLAFLIYIIAVLVLVLNAKYLPADRREGRSEKQDAVKRPANWRAYLVILGMSLVNVAFYTFSTSIALFLKSESIGNDATSGYTVAVFMAAGFLMGIVVPHVRKYLKYFTVTLGCLMMGVGYIGLATSSNIILLILSSALIGASYSVFYSSVFLKIGALSRDDRENTKLVTFTTAGMFFGRPSPSICCRGPNSSSAPAGTGSASSSCRSAAAGRCSLYRYLLPVRRESKSEEKPLTNRTGAAEQRRRSFKSR